MVVKRLGQKLRIEWRHWLVAGSLKTPMGVLTSLGQTGSATLLVTTTFTGMLLLSAGCNTWRSGYPAQISIRPAASETSRLLRNAHYYKLMGRPEAALKEMEEAHLADPNNLKIADALAQNYQQLGQFQRAQEIYQEFLAHHGSNCALQNNLCFSFYLQGNLTKAESCFKEALERDPGNAAARNNLGLLWCRQGKLAEAQRLWEEAEGVAGGQARMNQALAFLGMEAPTNYAKLPEAKLQHSRAVSAPKPTTPATAAYPAQPKLAAAPAPVEVSDSTPPPMIAPKVEQKVAAKPVPQSQAAAPRQPAASQIPPSAAKATKTNAPTTGKVLSPAPNGNPSRPELKEADRPGPPSPPLTALERETTDIEVRNGNGTKNLARQSADLLYQEVFNVTKIGDHTDFGAESTVIYCRPGAERVAQGLKWQIFPKARIEESSKLKDGVAIKILLGHDLLDQPLTMARLAAAASGVSHSAPQKTKPAPQPRAEVAKEALLFPLFAFDAPILP